MIKQCNHHFIKLYYRKRINKNWADMIHLDNLYVCDKCFEISEMKKKKVIKKWPKLNGVKEDDTSI